MWFHLSALAGLATSVVLVAGPTRPSEQVQLPPPQRIEVPSSFSVDPAPRTRPLGTLEPGAVQLGDLPDAVTAAISPTAAAAHPVPGSLTAGHGCHIQCITSGVAHPRGEGARLAVTTDTPATIWILVLEAGQTTSPMVFQSSPGATSFVAHADELDGGTTYEATAVATDSSGSTSVAWGTFTTLERHLTLDMEAVDILEWPDVDVTSEDVLFRVDGAELPGDPWGQGHVDLGAVNRHVDLEAWVVLGYDGPDLCQAWDLQPNTQPYGSVACTIWTATALDDIDLDAHPGNDESWNHHTLDRVLTMPGDGALPAGTGHPLQVAVPIQLVVTYE